MTATLGGTARAKDGLIVSPPESWLKGYFNACWLSRSSDAVRADVGLRHLVDLSRHCPIQAIRLSAHSRVNIELAALSVAQHQDIAQ